MNRSSAPAQVALAMVCFSALMFSTPRGQAGAVSTETSEPPIIPIGYDVVNIRRL